MGQSWASKIQIGHEATKGTAVAATTVLRAPFAALEDVRDPEYADEQLGAPLPSSRLITPSLLARLPIPAAWATPEQLPYYLEMGIKSVQTGVADGTGSSGYVYAYSPGITSLAAIATYTVETGDDVQAEEAEYCFAEQIVISGAAQKHVMMSANLIGRQVSGSTFTGALSVPTVTRLLTGNSTLYIDDSGGTIGTTQVSAGTIQGWTLTIATGRKARYTADSGFLYFVDDYFDRDAFSAMLEITFEHVTGATNEKSKWRSGTGRLVRLDVLGDAYATAGTGTLFSGYNGLRIDIPGTWQQFNALEKSDGRTLVKGTLGRGYIASQSEVLEITVANEQASLT